MPVRTNNPSGKVFGYIPGQSNTPSKGLEKKIAKVRSGQRANLVKMGVPKKLVKKIINGQ